MIRPTYIVHVGLIFIGLLFGEVVWRLMSARHQSFLSSQMMAICFGCIGMIWALRDKADLVLQPQPNWTSEEIERELLQIAYLRKRSVSFTLIAAVSSLLVGIPSLSLLLMGKIWHWMSILSGVAAAECLFILLIAAHNSELLRRIRDNRLMKFAKDLERRKIIERLEVASETPINIHPWKSGGEQLTST